jgi:hypothetical protein
MPGAGPCPGNLKCASLTACLTACGSDADCVAGAPYCDASQRCTSLRPIGGGCGGDGDCQNNQCVDGHCCDQPCTGQCVACDVVTHEGHCVQVTSDTPHGSRTPCTGSSTEPCAGSCQDARDRCTYPGTSTACTFTCTIGTPSTCDGAGNCAPPAVCL